MDSDCPWPLAEEEQGGWFEGIPYFLQDLRPEGFLGWAFARSYGRHLGLAEDPREWTEEDALQALSRFGVDPSGNHIIGSAALELYLNEQKNPREPLQEAHVPPGYSELADKAVALDIRNSLVPGKFPKFTALREVDGIFARVLVKFSGLDDSPSSVRWADLLVCEHLEGRTLSEVTGIQAAETRVVEAEGRIFLESLRFDRLGMGRTAVCTWAAINDAWFGLAGRSWTEGAAALLERGLVEPYGRRRHSVHLALRKADRQLGHARSESEFLAAADRLSSRLCARSRLRYVAGAIRASTRSRVATSHFEPSLPLPEERSAWMRAARAAVQFWDEAARDANQQRISCALCGEPRSGPPRIARPNSDLV